MQHSKSTWICRHFSIVSSGVASCSSWCCTESMAIACQALVRRCQRDWRILHEKTFFYWHLLISLDDHWWLFHIVSESFDESHLLFSDLVGSQAPIRRNLAFLSYCCVDVGAAPESSGCFLLSSQGRYRVAVPVPAEAQHVTDFWTLASA